LFFSVCILIKNTLAIATKVKIVVLIVADMNDVSDKTSIHTNITAKLIGYANKSPEKTIASSVNNYSPSN